MLYLIKTYGKDKELLKIGFTDNIEYRMNQYKSCNPLFEIIDTRDGDEVIEKLFHLRFRTNYQYTDYGKEWFWYNSEIIDGFRDFTESDLLKYIWENRRLLIKEKYFSLKTPINEEVINRVYFNHPREDLDMNNPCDILWDKLFTSKKIISEVDNLEAKTFLIDFYNQSEFTKRMRLYCETNLSPDSREMIDTEIPIEYSNYYKFLGLEVCRANKYQRGEILKEYNNKLIKSSNTLLTEIYSSFPILNSNNKPIFYSCSDIRDKLQIFYNIFGLIKTAKALDILDYFEAKKTKKRFGSLSMNGYYLIKPKS